MPPDAGASAAQTISLEGTDVLQAASEALASSAGHALAVSATQVLAVSLLEPVGGKTACAVV